MVDAEEFADWMHPGHGKGAARHDSLALDGDKSCCFKERPSGNDACCEVVMANLL